MRAERAVTEPTEPSVEPRLLGPQPLMVAGGVVACVVMALALLAFAAGEDLFGGAASHNSEDLVRQVGAAGSTGEIFVPIDFRSRDQGDAALAQLRLDLSEIGQIRAGLTKNRLRLVMTTMWDWADEDGDKVRVTSVGFSQDIVLRRTPQLLVVPYEPGAAASMTVRALADGGGGGITVGLGSPVAPLRLRSLVAGESVQVGLP